VEPRRLYFRSGNPRRLDVRAKSSGSSCGRRASTWEPWMTATGSPRHEGSDWTAGLGPFVGDPRMTRPPGFYPSSPPSSVDSLANGDDRAETVVRIRAICIWEISPLTDGPEILWPLSDRMAQSTEIHLHTTSSLSIWQETGTRQMDAIDDLITRSDMRDLLHDF